MRESFHNWLCVAVEHRLFYWALLQKRPVILRSRFLQTRESRRKMSYVTNHKYEWVMSPIVFAKRYRAWMSHVTYEWVMSPDVGVVSWLTLRCSTQRLTLRFSIHDWLCIFHYTKNIEYEMFSFFFSVHKKCWIWDVHVTHINFDTKFCATLFAVGCMGWLRLVGSLKL